MRCTPNIIGRRNCNVLGSFGSFCDPSVRPSSCADHRDGKIRRPIAKGATAAGSPISHWASISSPAVHEADHASRCSQRLLR